jgi:hypothetical protein
MDTTEFPPYKGLAILIKAPGVTHHFVPREGETITITDKDGKELWSVKIPRPIRRIFELPCSSWCLVEYRLADQ